jgi:hypothetical protein
MSKILQPGFNHVSKLDRLSLCLLHLEYGMESETLRSAFTQMPKPVIVW